MASFPSNPATLLDLARQDLASGQIAAAPEKCLRVLDAHHHHPAALEASYSRAFGFWYSQSSLLRPDTHELKYEQLAADCATEVERLCAFLQLPRHEAMLAPGAHARAKGFISTPSYAQVLEPISNRSVGRWKHYERHFDSEVLALLMPWIERWGYSLG